MKKMFLFLLPAVLLAVGCGKDDDTCSVGYTGSDCLTEITPTIATLKAVQVSISSTGWDVLDNPLPEPFIVIKNNSSGQELARSSPGTNTNTHIWTGALELGPSETVRAEIYDYDSTTASDFIGAFTQKMYQVGAKFQSTYTGTANGVTITFTIQYTH